MLNLVDDSTPKFSCSRTAVPRYHWSKLWGTYFENHFVILLMRRLPRWAIGIDSEHGVAGAKVDVLVLS